MNSSAPSNETTQQGGKVGSKNQQHPKREYGEPEHALETTGARTADPQQLVIRPDVVKNRRPLFDGSIGYRVMADRFAAADPEHRVVWFGPDMSVRSRITARLMETWAYGQAIYDLLGTPRVDRDRIKNIVRRPRPLASIRRAVSFNPPRGAALPRSSDSVCEKQQRMYSARRS